MKKNYREFLFSAIWDRMVVIIDDMVSNASLAKLMSELVLFPLLGHAISRLKSSIRGLESVLAEFSLFSVLAK